MFTESGFQVGEEDTPVQAIDIAVIRGDGIGPELVDAALGVLDAAGSADGLRFSLTEVQAGPGTEAGLLTAARR